MNGNTTMTLHADSAARSADAGSLARYHRALELALTSHGNPLAEVDHLLADDAEFIPGHCLRSALIVRADDHAARSKVVASVTAIEAACPDENDPARRHASAARAWLDGDPALAAERYGAILIDWPRDILALVVAHALDFRAGQRRMLRDRVAQVFPQWDAAAPGYASVLALYAFGLEENGQYRRAEKMARRALTLDPHHPGAIHVIAHVMEMQGRAREGLEFLAETESVWREGTGYSVHLAWHRALFHLDADEPEAALAVYDAQIANTRIPEMSALADASALLWRLQLLNVRLGERWQTLADHWETLTLTEARPFYVAHAMMALIAAGRAAAVQRIFDALPHPETSRASASYSEDSLMLPFCKALLAFAHGDYASSVEWLTRVHHIADRCGGSLAQCDLIHLTYTEAALRARKASLARALVAERTAQKPTSRLNRVLQRRTSAAFDPARRTKIGHS
jgi:tetratricopeptide (TPR) repeat protein